MSTEKCECQRTDSEICGVFNNRGFFCTRNLGHTGNHVACGNGPDGQFVHNLQVWSNDAAKETVTREMWAVVLPDGHIVTGSDLNTEERAWTIALGWPGEAEIEHEKKRGAFAVKATLTYQKPCHT